MEPGVVLDELNRHVAPSGLQYAPDPTTSNRACVGGGVGNNTCGSHSVIYGKTVDHVPGAPHRALRRQRSQVPCTGWGGTGREARW